MAVLVQALEPQQLQQEPRVLLVKDMAVVTVVQAVQKDNATAVAAEELVLLGVTAQIVAAVTAVTALLLVLVVVL
jgi:hypothetical protein